MSDFWGKRAVPWAMPHRCFHRSHRLRLRCWRVMTYVPPRLVALDHARRMALVTPKEDDGG
jgi:hypothetical protein